MPGMITRSIPTAIAILLPTPYPKTVYFICTLLQVLAFLIFLSAHYLPSSSGGLFAVGMAITGIGRSVHAFPYFVTYYNIDGANHPTLIKVWMGLSSTGNTWGLLFSLLVVYGMGWSWMANLLVYALVYLALSIGFQLVMDEVQMERQMDSPWKPWQQ